jgi:transposase
VERAEAAAILDGDRETAVALLLRVGGLVEANQRLEARVAGLERRLKRSSGSSSLPPSQDPPSAPKRPGGRGSGRGRGAQPGHEGRYRRLVPPDQVDEVVEHGRKRCRSCAHVCEQREVLEAVEAVAAPGCGAAADRGPGERASRARGLLSCVCDPDRGRTARRCALGVRAAAAGGGGDACGSRPGFPSRDDRAHRELFGVELASGSVEAIIQRAGEALAGPCTLLEQRIRSAPVVNIDESGWKTAGGNRTLWGALGSATAVVRIAAGRHRCEARTLLGERFAGIVCSDRWRGDDSLAPARRQLCWAHLLRDFAAHSEGMAEQQRFGSCGLVLARELFAAWDGYQLDGDRARLQAQIAPLQGKLRRLLEHAARKRPRTKYQRLFANNLLKRWPALSTCSHSEGVQPTNNHAERGLRGAVVYRKLSRGSHSDRGERTIERLPSASVTCRLRNQPLIAYLTQVITAHARRDPIPALA